MIVLVYGSLPDDAFEVSTKICKTSVEQTGKRLKAINLSTIMRNLSKENKWAYSKLCLDSNLAINVLKAFEKAYGSVIVHGNLFITEGVLNEISTFSNSIILVTYREEYMDKNGDLMPAVKSNYGWMDDEVLIKYYCGNRYRTIFDRLNCSKSKKAQVFLSLDGKVEDDVTDYIVAHCDDSACLGLNPEKIIYEIMLNQKEVLSMPNDIEKAIKDCMKRLGYNSDNLDFGQETSENTTETPVSKSESYDPNKKQRVDKSSPIKSTPVPKAEETVIEEDLQVLCKIQDGKMVLFIPQGMSMETVTTGEDECWNALTFEAPDFNTSKLQILDIQVKSQKPEKPEKPEKTSVEEPIVRVPIKFIKETPEETEEISELDALISQKSELDAAIKEARKSDDTDLVNSLRKKRRAVRNKINALQK